VFGDMQTFLQQYFIQLYAPDFIVIRR